MVDAAFVGVGQKAGLELWRIEKLKPVRVPKIDGKFYSGDSYILLSTVQTRAGGFNWSIHFWLGSETSQDEAGVAAYKTVELDESLGGGPVQFREVQGYESQQFLSYFKNTGGIEYLPGGIESGFRKVERDVYVTRLLHLKGKRTVRVNEVPAALASLNKGDVFILDKGLKIFLFNGPSANKNEKAKGIEVANRINSDERGARAELILIDSDPQNTEFWSEFGGYRDPTTLPEGPEDTDVDIKLLRKIFKISDATGTMEFSELTPPDGKLIKSMLVTDDVFLVQGLSKLFIWIGKRSAPTEKKEATLMAVQYIKNNHLPPNTAIERVSEGNETGAFKSEFQIWDLPMSFNTKQSNTTAARAVETPQNVSELLNRRSMEEAPVDDGSGKLDVWVINNFKKEPIDPSNYGEFFGGDSYILLYSYKKGRSDEYIIYFWLGNESTPDEKGAAALLSVQLDDSLGGKPVQVRVTQGKEPAHFRQLFKGRMIVYKGGNASGFAAKTGDSTPPTVQDDIALFHVRGTNALNTFGLQVNAITSSLNSEDSFVLVTPSTATVWLGNGCNESEVAVAQNIANMLANKYKGTSRPVQVIREGSEPDEFWEALGGKTEYAQVSPGQQAPRDARLFSASTATGSFKVEEVDNFDQTDLNDEDVFLLDTFTQLFVWIGSQSSQEEKDKAVQFAQRFIQEADDGRDKDIPIIAIHAGAEPSLFSCHFMGWDPEYTKRNVFADPYQARLDAIAAEKAKKAGVAAPLPLPAPARAASVAAVPAPAPVRIASVSSISGASSAVGVNPPKPGSFTLAELKGALPVGVDPTQKEEYLDDATFKSVFNMERAAFRAQPKWKRDDAKKKQGLF
jgi:advillin